jgi:hypothetical protein
MNTPAPQIPGGGFPSFVPIWHPPVATQWILTVAILFAGAVANRIPSRMRTLLTNPLGFFLMGGAAIMLLRLGYAPIAFATLFALLSIWSVEQFDLPEGFLNGSNTVDWVTSSKRWWVEKVLKERPMGIQEKDVDTYPVQGSSAQGGTSAGNT